MGRLIDADRIVYSWIVDNDGEEHDGITLQSIIDKIPTVDAVEVVRCKDCKHYFADPWGFGNCSHGTSEHGFCAWGERRENEQTD